MLLDQRRCSHYIWGYKTCYKVHYFDPAKIELLPRWKSLRVENPGNIFISRVSPTLSENQSRTRYPSVKSTFLLVPDQQGAELKRTHHVHCGKGNSMVNRDN